MATNSKLYDDVIKAYQEAYPSLPKKDQFCRAQNLWNELKEKSKEDPQAMKKKLGELRVQAIKVKNQSRLKWDQYFHSSKKPKEKPTACAGTTTQ